MRPRPYGLPPAPAPQGAPPGAPDQSAAPVPPLHVFEAAGVAAPPLWWLGDLPTGEAVWVLPTSSEDCTGWWLRLRAVHDRTGVWPVLLGDHPDSDVWGALRHPHDHPAAAELEHAAALDVVRMLGTLEEMYAEDDEVEPYDEYVGDRVPTRLYPTFPRPTMVEAGWLALVEVEDDCDLPARVGWLGGVNGNMRPGDHVAVLRRWRERYGVEVMGLKCNQTLYLAVDRPPTDPQECRDVALEQLLYCSDLIDERASSIEELAAEQVPSRTWTFWWD